MPTVSKIYVPKVENRRNEFLSKTSTTLAALDGYPNVLQLPVSPELSYRKVWAGIVAPSTVVWRNSVELVATLHGREVYTQQLQVWGSTLQAGDYFSGWMQTGATTGSGGEIESMYYSSGVYFAFGAWRLNLAADKMFLRVGVNTGAGARHGLLHIVSQAGV